MSKRHIVAEMAKEKVRNQLSGELTIHFKQQFILFCPLNDWEVVSETAGAWATEMGLELTSASAGRGADVGSGSKPYYTCLLT